jgi:glucosamine-phosphate N-acetyltransferase
MNNFATIGHIDCVAVSRDQKGKKMGLRILEALTTISSDMGCKQTVVSCSNANKAFHAQVGYVEEGNVMVIKHHQPVPTDARSVKR